MNIIVAALVLAATAAVGQVPAVDTEDLLAQIKRDSNLLVIDLRGKAEYEDGHLPFAVNVPWGDAGAKPEAKLEALLKTDPRPIVVYGADALTLTEVAAKSAALNGGSVAVYPAGVEGWTNYAGGFLEIEWPGLWRLLSTQSPVVLDARGAEEYGAGHVPGARHFDPSQVSEKFLAKAPWAGLIKKEPVWVTYCGGEMCGESRRLAELLGKAGAKRVYHFPGGYPEWVEKTACLLK